MTRSLKARFGKEEDDGFTLIELMVVVLIIAILIAIAIPTFLGAREKAQDRGAQSSLRNALTAAKVLYADDGDYSNADPVQLKLVEPSLTFPAVGTDSAGPNQIATNNALPDSDTFRAAALSDSGDCFYIRDGGNGTFFGSIEDGALVCAGADATDAAAPVDKW